MATPDAGIPAKTIELYDALVASVQGVERKGAKTPYTSLNGHMFSFLTNEGKLALRLPADDRETFIKKYRTKLCEQHGVVMKEYVVVPATLLKKTSELKKHFAASYEYISSLKPKPTTRKKATKAKAKNTLKKRVAKKARKKTLVKKKKK